MSSRLWVLALAFLGCAMAAQATVTFDFEASNEASGSSTLTLNHTIISGPPFRYLVVFVHTTGNTPVSTVLCNSSPMVFLRADIQPLTNDRLELWTLQNPASGGATISINTAATTNIIAGSQSYYSSVAAIQPGASASVTVNGSSSMVVNINTLGNNSEIVGSAECNLSTPPSSVSQTLRWNQPTGSFSAEGDDHSAGSAGPYSSDYSFSGTANGLGTVLELGDSIPPTPTPDLSLSPSPTPSRTSTPTVLPTPCGSPLLANSAILQQGQDGNNLSSATFSYSVGGSLSNALVLVEIEEASGAPNISSMYYGSLTLSPQANISAVAGGTLWLYSVTATALSGSNNFVINFSPNTNNSSWVLQAQSYSSVNQALPLISYSTATQTLSPFTDSLSTTGAQSLLVDFLDNSQNNFPTGEGGGQQPTGTIGFTSGFAAWSDTKAAGAPGLQNMTYTWSPGGTTIKSWLWEINGAGCALPTPTASPSYTPTACVVPPSSSIFAPAAGPMLMPGAASIIGNASAFCGALSQVQVSIQNQTTLQYYNGISFSSPTQQWLAASGTSSWTYNSSGIWVAGDTYVISSRAIDTLSNTQSAPSTVTVQAVNPTPTPTRSSTPGASPTGSPSATASPSPSPSMTATPSPTATWTPCLTAPSSSVWSPQAGSYANSPPVLSGTASAGCGSLALVGVSVQRLSDGLYWDSGTSAFDSAAPLYLPAASAGSTWTYTGPPPAWASGVTYTVRSRAQDSFSNLETPAGGNSFTYCSFPPNVSSSTPLNGGNYVSILGFDGVASGVCAPMQSVLLTLQRNSDSSYWNGFSWGPSVVTLTASLGSGYAYTTVPPWLVDSYTLGISGQDAAANVTSQTVVFNIVAPSPTVTATFSATPSNSPSPTWTATPSASPTGTPTATATWSPSNSPSPTWTVTPSVSPSSTPSESPTGTPTATATWSPSNSPSPTWTATPSASPTATETATRTATASASASPSASPTFSASPTISVTVTSSSTPSVTLSATPNISPTATPTHSPLPTLTASFSPTAVQSPTISPTYTTFISPTITLTWSVTNTPVPTATPNIPAVLDRNVFYPEKGSPLFIGIKAPKDGRVTVKIYDIAGGLVLPVCEMDLKAGITVQASWNGHNDDGSMVASGIYFVSIQGAGIRRILKVVVLK
jgi:hypothetical protein